MNFDWFLILCKYSIIYSVSIASRAPVKLVFSSFHFDLLLRVSHFCHPKQTFKQLILFLPLVVDFRLGAWSYGSCPHSLFLLCLFLLRLFLLCLFLSSHNLRMQFLS